MVGELIARRRRALKLSQTQLGVMTNTSQRQVSRLENGEDRTLPRRDTLEKFGRALGISMAEFYRAAGVIEDTEDEEGAPPRVIQVTTRQGPLDLDLDQVIAFVESKPDHRHQDTIARWRTSMDRRDYERVLLKLFLAWDSNEDLVVTGIETVRPDLGPRPKNEQ